MPRTLAWRRADLDRACQSGNMTILLTSLLFVFEFSFLPKYRVNYYDYIIKWCLGYNVTGMYRWILPTFLLYVLTDLIWYFQCFLEIQVDV